MTSFKQIISYLINYFNLINLFMNRLQQLSKQMISAKLDSFSEWNQSKIDKQQMENIVFGPNNKIKQQFFKLVQDNPQMFKHYHILQSDREEQRKNSAQQLFFIKDKMKIGYDTISNQPNKMSMLSYAQGIYNQGLSVKNGVHTHLYSKTVKNLGTEKHRKFVEDALEFRDIGCFGLTQLLHGSNVRGILTEAHYDHKNKQFIMHSPTRDAMKFWIGAAGNIANMAVIWAQLYIDSKCYGVHAYIVPIRDKKTHRLLPGVLVGDCGPKNGLNNIDNGFIMLDTVRIPRQNQLDRISGVDENGKFRSLVANEQKRFGLQLGSLSGGRFLIGVTAAGNALNALTIAIRYVCLRRQFSNKPGQKENLLIEYPLTKRRMMPLLAQTFIYLMGNMFMMNQWDKNHKNILNPQSPVIQQLHAISSVTKPKTGWFATEVIKQCRQMLGGHGFSAYAKLGVLYNDNDINNTWEGDNNVLIQQTAKFALDSAQKAMKGKPITSPILKFLQNPPKQDEIKIEKQFLLDHKCGVKFLKYKIKTKIDQVLKRMAELKGQNMSSFDIWNHSQVFLAKNLSLAIGDLFYLTSTLQSLKQFKNQNNIRVVKDLLTLWLLKVYREDQFIDQVHHPLIEDLMAEYCEKVSLQSLAILESISTCDKVIGSPFADPEGNGFQKYLQLIMDQKNSYKKPEWWKIVANRGQ